MSTPLCDRAESVRVGVVLTSVPAGNSCVVTGEGGRSIDYKSGRDEEAESFSFEQVVVAENFESFHPELLQPLTDSMSRGFNAALLICGASTEKISTLIDQNIIKQVLENLFSGVSQVKGDWFVSVSFLQFYPDGTAVDLLSPDRQTPKLLKHPILGNIVVGQREVCVCSAEEAFTLYEMCRDKLKSNAGSMSSRCSSLFSVAVERKLHQEELEVGEVSRSRLQLFSVAGGATRSDLRGVSPLVKVVDQTLCEAATSEHLLPSLLHEALTGNSRTALIYCVQPEGLLNDETLSV